MGDGDPHGWREEGRNLVRGIAAGSIVGVPLLYTMEMWWHGMTLPPWGLLAILLTTFALNVLFSMMSGFRQEYSFFAALADAVSAVAVALLVAGGMLALIAQWRFAAAWPDAIGRIVIEAMPMSLGISFANMQMRDASRSQGSGGGSDPSALSGEERRRRQLRQDVRNVGVAVVGAGIFAFNVAPTQEVMRIALRLSAPLCLAMVAVSLALSYLTLFAAGFRDRVIYVNSVFQHPLAETVMAYAVALVVSFVLLALVGVPGAIASLGAGVRAVVVLGLPAVIGASAGRLI
jgi:putative integral membrane protein (TIGR02587 family)